MTATLFIDRFRAVAWSRPNGPAIVQDGEVVLTYMQLWAEASHLAAELERGELRRGEFVGLCMEKSPEFVVGLIAIWIAGGAFVPLDPRMPDRRLLLMAQKTDMRFVLGRRSRDSSWAPPQLRVLGVEIAGRSDGSNTRRACAEADRAYAIFTSGSTGRPKGVVVTQRGLVNLFDAQMSAFGLTEDSRVLWLLSPSFDASVSDLGTCFLAGASLHIETSLQCVSTSAVLTALRSRKITHVDLPPSLLAQIDVEEAPESLSTMVIGGEVCSEQVVRRWSTQVRLINVYGPTEATVCSSLSLCDQGWDRPLIGEPLPSVEYLVLSQAKMPVGAGEIGELYIGGVGVAEGYIGDPELTAEKFITIQGERFFRSGDLVKLCGDGAFEFMGRVDRQFKARGVLVAPEEIEAALREHDGVVDAVVVPNDLAGRNRIAVYYTGTASSAELRVFARQALPRHLVPDSFVFLESLPRGHSGKIDVSQLDSVLTKAQEHSTPLVTQTEIALARAWEWVLDTQPVHAGSDFFELGGDSLSAVELAVAAEAEGVPVTVEQVYAFPRLAALAQEIDDHQQANASISCDLLKEDPVLLSEWKRESDTKPSVAASSGVPHYLVTGATGFLGGQVLRFLLESTEAKITLLVRARSDDAANDRVAGLQVPAHHRHRLVALRGDICVAQLGLDCDRWQGLAQRIDGIYHCAADVNLAKPYVTLRPANVMGTRHVLELLRAGKSKTLHYASTLSVFVGSERNTGVLREDSPLEDVGALHGGYAQSKWVAEMLVRRAAEELGGVSVYRFGLLTGDSRTGDAPQGDWLRMVIRGLVELGAVPDFGESRARLDITPVDYAAAAMVELSLSASLDDIRTFHVANSSGATFGDLVAAMRRVGVEIAMEAADVWRARAAEMAVAPTVAATVLGVSRFLPVNTAYKGNRACDLFQATDAIFDTRNTDRALLGTDIRCPEPSEELLDRYIGKMLQEVRR
jgi:amino acid adenylation domain-containing protein/thioester reductase-like protein